VPPADIQILVVDPDPDTLLATVRILQEAQFQVITGAGAADAFELARRHRPPLLVLDVTMPDGNGCDVARQLKGDPALADLFVILVSDAKESPDDSAQGLADGVLVRPFGKAEFLAQINAVVRIWKTEEALRASQRDREAERKQADVALGKSEARLSFVLEVCKMGAWDLDLLDRGAHRTFFHDRIFGYDTLLPGWTYEMFLEHVLAEDRADVDRSFREALAAQSDWSFECRIRRADGKVRWIWAAGGHERNQEGEPTRMAGIVQDITARKQAEEELRRNGNTLAQILNSVPQTVFWKDRNSVYLGCNEVFARTIGLASPEEIVGKTDFDLRWPRKDAEGYIADDKEVMENNRPKRHFLEQEQLPDGKRRWVETTKVPLTDIAGKVCGVLGVYEDVTERKQMEEKLRLTHRMESIGRLASGIAHDLNNILTPILFSADMLRTTEERSAREGLIATIEASAQRGANVVQQVLTFSRGTPGERKTLRLKTVVSELERMIRDVFPKKINFATSIPPDLHSVRADSTQIHQVLLNLCINARDAMPAGGSLLLSGDNREVDEAFAATAPDAKPGEYVMLAVTDSGTGMPHEIIDKIFDPFFTTKKQGEGTGLGLSTVIGIIRSHGGFITVESVEALGSTFKVFLPAETGDAGK